MEVLVFQALKPVRGQIQIPFHQSDQTPSPGIPILAQIDREGPPWESERTEQVGDGVPSPISLNDFRGLIRQRIVVRRLQV